MRGLVFLVLFMHAAFAMNNGLARSPPMGWSSWNAFGGKQSPDEMMAAATSLISLGLDKLGYTKVDIDGGCTYGAA